MGLLLLGPALVLAFIAFALFRPKIILADDDAIIVDPFRPARSVDRTTLIGLSRYSEAQSLLFRALAPFSHIEGIALVRGGEATLRPYALRTRYSALCPSLADVFFARVTPALEAWIAVQETGKEASSLDG